MITKAAHDPVPSTTMTNSRQEDSQAYTLECFQTDVCWLFFLQMQMIEAMTSERISFNLIGKLFVDAHAGKLGDPECTPADIDLSYADVRDTPFAQSLEAMYMFAYHGKIDDRIEELGPGGYHIVMAAIVNDLAKSSLVNFWAYLGHGGRDSAKNCLRTAELANARLVLEGQDRFFNFDSRDDDYASLWTDATTDAPEGKYGDALTVRQMALLAGMGEMTIRTAANPKRAKHIPTYSHAGRTVIAIEHAKVWLLEKGRYIPVKRNPDPFVLQLERRKFVGMADLFSFVLRRLCVLDHDVIEKTRRLAKFQDLGTRYGLAAENANGMKMAYSNADFIHEAATILSLPSDLFALRVKELLLDDEIRAVRREVSEAVQKSNS